MNLKSSGDTGSFNKDTVFVVNVMHNRPGRQTDTLACIRDIVRYASHKPGFLWSALASSEDGETVVNVEAIADPGNVGHFFADPVFDAKFRQLAELCSSEFHVYRVTDLISAASAR